MDSKPLNLLVPTYTQPTPCTQPPLPHTHHHHRHNQTNFTSTNNNNNSTSCLPTDLPQPTQPSPTHHAFPTSHILSQPHTTPQSSTHHQPPHQHHHHHPHHTFPTYLPFANFLSHHAFPLPLTNSPPNLGNSKTCTNFLSSPSCSLTTSEGGTTTTTAGRNRQKVRSDDGVTYRGIGDVKCWGKLAVPSPAADYGGNECRRRFDQGEGERGLAVLVVGRDESVCVVACLLTAIVCVCVCSVRARVCECCSC